MRHATGAWAGFRAAVLVAAVGAIAFACRSAPAPVEEAKSTAPAPAARHEVGELIRVRVSAERPIGGPDRRGLDDRARAALLKSAPEAQIVVRGPEQSRTVIKLVDASYQDDGWLVARFVASDVSLPRIHTAGRYEVEVRPPPGVSLRVEPRRFESVAGPAHPVVALAAASTVHGSVDAVFWVGGRAVQAQVRASTVKLEGAAHRTSLARDGE